MPEIGVRELTFGQAVREALAEEMRHDPRVCIFGEDVAEAGTPFKVLSGLVEEFGTERVLDTPISEAGFTGIAVGAAMTGLRPIVDIMFGDFITLTMDQMVNQAAKVHYMSGGAWTIANEKGARHAIGYDWAGSYGRQHGQASHARRASMRGVRALAQDRRRVRRRRGNGDRLARRVRARPDETAGRLGHGACRR